MRKHAHHIRRSSRRKGRFILGAFAVFIIFTAYGYPKINRAAESGISKTALFAGNSAAAKANYTADSTNYVPDSTDYVPDGVNYVPDNAATAESGTPWNLALVNAWNPIPEDYRPDLTEVPGGQLVDSRIYEPLMEMLEAAREGNAGELPIIVSGYRTREKQQSLYDEKIAEYEAQGYSESEATALAGQWVALPGTSEHQLGLAVDINGAVYDIYPWLKENSYKYGFIFRYPGDKSDMTGISEEVWHYRYVGVQAATEIYEQGICLEEYLAH